MKLTSVPLDEVPVSSQGRRHVFSPDQIADAIEALQEGRAVKSEGTYPNNGQARKAGLILKHLIEQEDVEFNDGLGPSTTLVKGDDDRYSFLIILRPPVAR